MKTALIIGGAALAAYAVWRLAQTQGTAVSAAVVGTGAYTPSGAPVGVPYPSAPPPVVSMAPVPAAVAATLPAGVLAQYRQGLITSVVPAFVNVSTAQRSVLAARGYRIISGNAYPTPALATQPPSAADAAAVVAGGGLPPAPPVYAQ